MVEKSFEKQASPMSGLTSTISTTEITSCKVISRPFRRQFKQYVIRFVATVSVCAMIFRGVIWRDTHAPTWHDRELEQKTFFCMAI